MLGVTLLALGWIQFATPHLAGNDGYYHIKLAQLMGRQGLLPHFTWLPLTVLNAAEFVDHHFLFHILLIPFTYGDLVLGAKLATVLFGALAVLALWRLLAGQQLAYAWAWALLVLALSEAFLYRLSLPRAQSLSLALLLLGLHWMLTKQWRWLFCAGFVYVWLYDGFPLLLVAAAAYFAAVYLIEGRWEFRAIAASGGGLLAGLVINPYFPRNVVFIGRHILPKLHDATAISVGNEWAPYDTQQLLTNAGPALALLCLALLILLLQTRRKPTVAQLLSLFMVFAFGLLLLRARRFVEYWPAMLLFFAAMVIDPALRRWQRARNKVVLAAALLALPLTWLVLSAAHSNLADTRAFDRYAGAAKWLEANTPPGSRVFQSDWDDFPELFFHNDHNQYMLGLDPSYMQLYDEELYDLWVAITRGRVSQPAAIILRRFGAGYAFSDLAHGAFLQAAEEDPAMQEVFRDEWAVIYEIDLEN